MSVIDEEPRTVCSLQLGNLREFGDVALHGEDPVDNDQLALVIVCSGQLPFEVRHIVVPVFQGFSESQTNSIDD